VAHSNSAKKRVRQSQSRRLRNRRRKDWVKSGVREVEQAVHDHKSEAAEEALSEAYKRLDRVAAKGTLHKKTVARKKSRLAKKVAAVGK
jgi:small subunit ribosomal protein S20